MRNRVGIGTNAPKGKLHVRSESIGVTGWHIPRRGLVVEGTTTAVNIISAKETTGGSGLTLGEVDQGTYIDTWSIDRQSNALGDGNLRLRYGPSPNHWQNPALFTATKPGLFGFGTEAPTARVDVNGATGYNQLRVRTSYTPTGTADPNGNVGDIAWDDNYFYVKTSAGWKRAALTTW